MIPSGFLEEVGIDMAGRIPSPIPLRIDATAAVSVA
jgi:hypothetical protein